MENKRAYFTTAQKTSKKKDIILLDMENERYMLFKDLKDEECDKFFDDEDYYLEYIEYGFDKLSSLAEHGNFDEIKRLILDSDECFSWDRYYAEIPNNDEEIHLIEIHTKRKVYKLYLNTSWLNSDGYTELGQPIDAQNVDIDIFNALTEGLKLKGYKEEKDA